MQENSALGIPEAVGSVTGHNKSQSLKIVLATASLGLRITGRTRNVHVRCLWHKSMKVSFDTHLTYRKCLDMTETLSEVKKIQVHKYMYVKFKSSLVTAVHKPVTHIFLGKACSNNMILCVTLTINLFHSLNNKEHND